MNKKNINAAAPNSITVVNSEEGGYSVNDTSFFTTAATDGRYYTKSQMGKEVTAINNVTARRLEDKRTFTRKNNPYCVFYAVYNFAPEPEWEALVQAMLNARKNDVKVQVLVDAQQLESYKVWNLGLLDLIKAGFKYSPTQLNLTIEEQDDYELIRKLGRGKYSEVFEGLNANNGEK